MYMLEMVVEKQMNKKRKIKGQNINRCRIDILKLEYVDILVYEFHLIKRDIIHFTTTYIIKRLLAQ
jgi:hypothetical protein